MSNLPDLAVHRDGGDDGMQPDPLLGRRGGAVAVELALLDLMERDVDMVHPRVREQPRAPLAQQRDLVGDADLERIRQIGRDPRDLSVRGLVRKLDALAVDGGGDLRDVDGLLAPPVRPPPG